MKIVFLRQYRSRKEKNLGQLVFVYKVNGTPEQLATYKASKGEFAREDKDTKDVLFFSPKFHKSGTTLIENSKKEWIADTSEADQLISMTAQCGGNVALAIELMKNKAE